MSPFLINKVFADGSVELHNPRDLQTFNMKGKMLKFYSGDGIPAEEVSLTTKKPKNEKFKQMNLKKRLM